MKPIIQHRIPFIEKWLNLPKIYHWGFFACCLSAVNFSVVFEAWQNRQQQQAIEQEIVQQSQELAHQEKLLATLEQQHNRHELSPKMTKEIVALDEQIQGLLPGEIKLESYQWDFSSLPALQIQLEGRFQALHAFFTQLLARQARLTFAQLNMQKMENGKVQSQLILQFKREE